MDPCLLVVLLPHSSLAQSGNMGVVDWHLYIIQEFADGGDLFTHLVNLVRDFALLISNSKLMLA